MCGFPDLSQFSGNSFTINKGSSDENKQKRVDIGILQESLHRPSVLFRPGRSNHVYWIRNDSFLKNKLSQGLFGPRAQFSQSQPSRDTFIHSDDGRPSSIGDNNNPIPFRHRLVGKSNSGIHHIFLGIKAKNSAFSENYIDQCFLLDHGTGVRSNSFCAFGCLSGLQGKNGFQRSDSACHFQKTSRILKSLDMNHDDFCPFILAIIIDDFIHAHIGLVTETGIHPYPHPNFIEMQLQCLSYPSTLSNDRDIPWKHRDKSKIGVDRCFGIRILYALGIWSIDAHSILVGNVDDLFFK